MTTAQKIETIKTLLADYDKAFFECVKKAIEAPNVELKQQYKDCAHDTLLLAVGVCVSVQIMAGDKAYMECLEVSQKMNLFSLELI